MGFFNNRKSSKVSIDGDSSTGSNSNRSSAAIKSPLSLRTPQSAYFSSPSLPDITLPKPPDPTVDPAGYLRSIHAVRERSRIVYEKAKRNQLNHFDVDMRNFLETAKYVRDYAPEYHQIPPHGRWQHFDVGGRPRIEQLLATWPLTVDNQERTRRLIDLFLVSVLLDAGSGPRWSYKSKKSGKIYRRSEGLAVASLEMFEIGMFSSNSEQPCQVDATGLQQVTTQTLARALQHSSGNQIAGLEGRAGLLSRLGDALRNQEYFGKTARPGNMLDYLMSHPTTLASSVPVIAVPTLWTVLMDGLAPIWPSSRTTLASTALGDAWVCQGMPPSPPAQAWESIVPFHKLTQWLAYSLMTPMNRLMHIHFAGADLLTGLPEYRNGGLLIDTGLLTLKDADMQRGLEAYRENALTEGQPNVEVVPLFETSDDVIVEWRAVTVGFLDDLLLEVNKQLGLDRRDGLTLAQMLEAGTWKGGREIAEVSRPNTKEPPIMIVSDGTVF
ncbi:hypothetical protein MMC25_006676 [Agyrium rufum]|nr:hypothetical protein [Agyrium rufum]